MFSHNFQKHCIYIFLEHCPQNVNYQFEEPPHFSRSYHVQLCFLVNITLQVEQFQISAKTQLYVLYRSTLLAGAN